MKIERIHRPRFTALLAVALTCQALSATPDASADRLTVTVRGHGPDVLLIPGLASSGAVWDATAAHLEDHFRLHVVQVAGFAGSPPQANAQGPVLQPTVNALDAYIRSNHLHAPRVIGHSLGGLMGGMLAFQHPEDVGGLMIVDSLPFYAGLFGAKDSAAAAPQATAIRDRVLDQTQEDYVKAETALMQALVKSPAGREQATQWAVTSDKSVVARAMYEGMTTDIRPQLSNVKTPVTILHAGGSHAGVAQAIPDQFYQESYAALPDKKLVRIDDSFHFIMLDQPEKFAAEVDRFLK